MFATTIYKNRRAQLISMVGQGVIVLLGNDLVGMNYLDNAYPFRQDSSFLYFCGVNRPGFAVLLDCDTGEEFLAGPEQTLSEVIWSGPQPSLAHWAQKSGIAHWGSFDQLAHTLNQVQAMTRPVHYLPPYRGEHVLKLASLLGLGPAEVEKNISVPFIKAVVALRSVKTGAEVHEIRQAIALSQQLYALLMTHCQPGITEQELYGRLQGFVLAQGSQEAFPTILTRRGQVLHNHTRDQVLAQGDLLLVDSGVCSKEGYGSDITRTLPVNGTFSSRQQDIYEVVLAAQAAGCAKIAPGVPFVDCHLAAARTVTQGLKDLGLMHGDPDDAVRAGAHALFFPHGLGHMLGLDTHDMENLGEDYVGYDQTFKRSSQFGLAGLRLARQLQSGFVVTVEPGIYFIPALITQWQAEKKLDAFIHYQALEDYMDFGGIRIEDDILVTEQGFENLSYNIPKNITELCWAMGQRS